MHPVDLEQIKPFDETRLGTMSRRLAKAISTRLPRLDEARAMALGAEADGLTLVVVAPSPTADSERSLVIWTDESGFPSLGFGPDHCHGGNDEDGITFVIEMACAIMEGRLVIAEDIGGAAPAFATWLDLGERDALADMLTSPYGTGAIRLKSWSGRCDRDVGIGDIDRAEGGLSRRPELRRKPAQD